MDGGIRYQAMSKLLAMLENTERQQKVHFPKRRRISREYARHKYASLHIGELGRGICTGVIWLLWLDGPQNSDSYRAEQVGHLTYEDRKIQKRVE